MHRYLYIQNNYIQHTQIYYVKQTFILDAINRNLLLHSPTLNLL